MYVESLSTNNCCGRQGCRRGRELALTFSTNEHSAQSFMIVVAHGEQRKPQKQRASKEATGNTTLI